MITAVDWLTNAEAGDPNAMLELGLIYDRSRDIPRALHWYQRAARAGNGDTARHLASLQQWRARRLIARAVKATVAGDMAQTATYLEQRPWPRGGRAGRQYAVDYLVCRGHLEWQRRPVARLV
jgi:TPR repeat protein